MITCPNCQGEVQADDLGGFRCPECGLVHLDAPAPRDLPGEDDPSCPVCGSVLLHVRDIYGECTSTRFTCAYCGFCGSLPGVPAPVIDFDRTPCRHLRRCDGSPVCAWSAWGSDEEEFLSHCIPVDPKVHCIRCINWRRAP